MDTGSTWDQCRRVCACVGGEGVPAQPHPPPLPSALPHPHLTAPRPPGPPCAEAELAEVVEVVIPVLIISPDQ